MYKDSWHLKTGDVAVRAMANVRISRQSNSDLIG